MSLPCRDKGKQDPGLPDTISQAGGPHKCGGLLDWPQGPTRNPPGGPGSARLRTPQVRRLSLALRTTHSSKQQTSSSKQQQQTAATNSKQQTASSKQQRNTCIHMARSFEPQQKPEKREFEAPFFHSTLTSTTAPQVRRLLKRLDFDNSAEVDLDEAETAMNVLEQISMAMAP